MTFSTVIGLLAAVCTAAANFPQLRKAWLSRQTDDLSLKMLLLLASGLALWVAYGVIHEDIVIVLGNSISLAMVSALVYLKLRYTSIIPRQKRQK